MSMVHKLANPNIMNLSPQKHRHLSLGVLSLRRSAVAQKNWCVLNVWRGDHLHFRSCTATGHGFLNSALAWEKHPEIRGRFLRRNWWNTKVVRNSQISQVLSQDVKRGMCPWEHVGSHVGWNMLEQSPGGSEPLSLGPRSDEHIAAGWAPCRLFSDDQILGLSESNPLGHRPCLCPACCNHCAVHVGWKLGRPSTLFKLSLTSMLF